MSSLLDGAGTPRGEVAELVECGGLENRSSLTLISRVAALTATAS
jgi:hypothetical protein